MVIESATGGTPGLTGSSPLSNGNLGRDAFLQLLVTQLQNQDPLSPMEDADFIAQMAQFASLEKLTQMADSLEILVASVLIPEGGQI